ncbi:MAG TPA: riboflavin synthase [Fimbriimonadales bacterium]|nr:riboflavin synthase [Fimbriimonadales bacterium]
MFTGIVQCVGEVIQPGSRLVVRGALPNDVPFGGSISVSGCCLTRVQGADLSFDLTEETLARTKLGRLRVGDAVNLEAALRAGDPIGGHFVLGHVDAVGQMISRDNEMFRFKAPTDGMRFIADKGSITIDGVSLTTIEPRGDAFAVSLVPHTLTATTLGSLAVGDEVNLEYDVIARYVVVASRV